MTSPHIELGNAATDIGQGAGSFISGLLTARSKAQQIALNQALAESKMALEGSQGQRELADVTHLGVQDDATKALLPGQIRHSNAQADLAGAQGRDATAQAITREQEGLPADEYDEDRLRQVEPKAPQGIFRGMSKAEANHHIQVIAQANASRDRLGLMERRMDDINNRFNNRGVPSYDANGVGYIIHPNQPGGGTPEQIGGGAVGSPVIGKPLSGADRKAAGSASTAKYDHSVLTMIEKSHPEVSQEVAKAISLPNFGKLLVIPGNHDAVSDILEQFRLMGASPEAQAYLKTMFDFVGVVGPMRYGVRGMQTPRGLQQIWSDFGAGQFGLGSHGVEAAQHNRLNALRQLQEQAGPRAMQQAQDLYGQPDPNGAAPIANKYTGVAKP